MPIPDSEKVIFKQNIIDRVICQLKFHPILRIDSELPAAFQERIRAEFPKFRETENIIVEPPPNLSAAISVDQFKQMFRLPSDKNYEFSSDDSSWKVNLSRTFISISGDNYERWTQFREKLDMPLNALLDIYAPNNFTRIGLRYVNVIKRSALKMENVEWTELIQPFVLGILSKSEMQDHIKNFQSVYEIKLLDGKSYVKLAAKFVQAVEKGERGELCFMIDNDFFLLGKIQIEEAQEKLRYFNIRAARLIQWCITERLREALGPQKL